MNEIKGTWKITSSKYDGKKTLKFLVGHLTFDGKYCIAKFNDKMF